MDDYALIPGENPCVLMVGCFMQPPAGVFRADHPNRSPWVPRLALTLVPNDGPSLTVHLSHAGVHAAITALQQWEASGSMPTDNTAARQQIARMQTATP
jgi:hypothetical protein